MSADWSTRQAFCYDDGDFEDMVDGEEVVDGDLARIVATTTLMGHELVRGFELNFSVLVEDHPSLPVFASPDRCARAWAGVRPRA